MLGSRKPGALIRSRLIRSGLIRSGLIRSGLIRSPQARSLLTRPTLRVRGLRGAGRRRSAGARSDLPTSSSRSSGTRCLRSSTSLKPPRQWRATRRAACLLDPHGRHRRERRSIRHQRPSQRARRPISRRQRPRKPLRPRRGWRRTIRPCGRHDLTQGPRRFPPAQGVEPAAKHRPVRSTRRSGRSPPGQLRCPPRPASTAWRPHADGAPWGS
jgi:hypothetical protein